MPNRVFHDYSDAKRYGELKLLTQGSIDSVNLEDIEDRFREKMAESHSEDWVLVSGAPLLNIIAAAVMLEKHGRVQLLQWDGVLKEYFPFTLEGKVDE